MISKLKLILLCPVPEDQKPISEYIGLKENPLTNWTTLSTKNYNAKIFSLFTSIFMLLSLLTFQNQKFWRVSFAEGTCLKFFGPAGGCSLSARIPLMADDMACGDVSFFVSRIVQAIVLSGGACAKFLSKRKSAT